MIFADLLERLAAGATWLGGASFERARRASTLRAPERDGDRPRPRRRGACLAAHPTGW
jgi:hypothetical protein